MKRLRQLFLAFALLSGIGAQAQKDVTSQYITNAKLSNGLTGWTVSNFNAPQQGNNTVGFASEAYAGWNNLATTSFNMTQNITLPAGHYTLVSYSFFRQGEFQNTNVNKSLAKLKAGDSEVALRTLGSITAGGYANTQAEGANAFDSKMYRNTLDFTIDADNTEIEIGIVGTFDEMRSWCIAGMFELINNDIPATMDTPLDVTGYLTNPGFEYRNVGGWALDNTGELSNDYIFQAQSNDAFGLKAGGYYGEAWQASGTLSDRSITQSLSNLPNGYYMLSANVSYGGSGAYVSLNDKKTAVEANNARRYTVGCVIDDGNLTVGLGLEGGTSSYLAFDGFSLLYCGDVTEALTTLCAQVTNYEGLIPTAAYNQLVSSVNEKNQSYSDIDELLQAISDVQTLYDEIDVLKSPYAAWLTQKSQATALVAVPNDNSSANNTLSTAITTQSTAAEASTTVEGLTTATSALTAAMSTYAFAASPTQGNRFDLTFLIETPDMTSLWDGTRNVRPSGWATEQTGGNFQVMQNDVTNSEDGLHNVFIEYYYLSNGKTYDNNKFNVYTTVNLPAGTYTMSCYAFAKEENYTSVNNPVVFFYANDTQGSLVNSSRMSEQSISFINDETQDVKIGLKPLAGNTYNWMGIGYVKLYKEYTDNTEYDITIAPVSNATVTTTVDGVDATKAKALKTVMMTFTPDENYSISSVTVSYNDGTTTQYLDVANPSVNVYTFQMPAYDVNVTATTEDREPYAVLSDDNTVLTFYYDNKRISRGGLDIEPAEAAYDISWQNYSSEITSVVFDESFANYTNLASTAYWFYDCTHLTSIQGIDNLKTGNVVNMAYMFASCKVIESIDVSGFDTRNVISFMGTFSACEKLKSLDVSHFDTQNAIYMSGMFGGCGELTSIDVSSFNTEKVTLMHYMFSGCAKVPTIDVSHFNTSKATNMNYMFENCASLTNLDLSNFTIGNNTSTSYMIRGCDLLETLTLPASATSFATNAFTGCTNLEYVASLIEAPTNVTLSESTFDKSVYQTAILFVPDGTLALYQAEYGWKNFKKMVDLSSLPTLLSTLCAQVTSYEGFIPTPAYTQLVSSVNAKNHEYNDNDELLQAIKEIYALYDEADMLKSPYAAWLALKSQATNLVVVPNDNSSANSTLNGAISTQDAAAEASTTVEGLTTAASALKTALTTYVAAASPTQGNRFDLTFMIETPDMTSLWDGTWGVRPSGWATEQTGGNFQVMQNDAADSEDGLHNVFIEYYYLANNKTYENSKFNVYTTVNLPVGTYTMSCYAFATQSGYTEWPAPNSAVFFYANDTQGSLVSTTRMSEQSISFINEETQDVKIGLKPLIGNNFNWMGIGYVKLYKEYADNTEYDITITPLSNATVTTTVDGVDATKAKALKTVTMTFTPDEEYRVSSVTVSYNDGTTTQYLDVANPSVNVYSFQMSAYDVTITANTVEAEAEPYAVLSENNTVLTFYYDKKRYNRGGDLDIEPVEYANYISWYGNRSTITTVVFDESFADCDAITSTRCWFYEFENLTSIMGIENLNTENVTDMAFMFYGCTNLTSLDVSGFNTANATTLECLFYNCSKLTSIDVSGFNTDKATSLGWMFYGCNGLQSVDISGFNTSKVTQMKSMFNRCSALTTLDISGFNTENVTNMSYMFYGCTNLTSLDVSGFDTRNVTDMLCMFSGCSGLTTLDVSNFITDKATTLQDMFYNCSNLTTLDVSGFNTENVTSLGWMFYGCSGLTSLDVSGFNTSKVTQMKSMFCGCSGLSEIDVTNFNTALVTDMSYMFKGCCKIEELDLSSFQVNGSTTTSYMINEDASLAKLILPSAISSFTLTSIKANTFTGCTSLNIVISSIDDPVSVWLADGAFDESVYQTATLVVPDGTASLYQAEDGWKKFLNIVEQSTYNPTLAGDVNGDDNIDSGDIMAVYSAMAGTADATTTVRADVNGDGNIDSGDIMAVYSIMAGK